MTTILVAPTLDADVKIRSTLLFAAAVWEVLRFVALYFLLSLQPSLQLNPSNALNLLWFGSVQLVLAAVLVLLAIYPIAYASYLRLARLGKLLSIPPGVAVFLSAGFTGGVQAMQSSALQYAELFVPIGILFVDLILFVYLLTCRSPEED